MNKKLKGKALDIQRLHNLHNANPSLSISTRTSSMEKARRCQIFQDQMSLESSKYYVDGKISLPQAVGVANEDTVIRR